RLKKSIQPLKSSLSRLLGLTPVKFSWKKDKFDFLKNSPTSETGLLAQDVEKVFPHLVSTDNKGFKKVNYGMELNMHVIGAVKELAKENEELKSKNAKLEKELEQTTKRIEKIEKLLGGK
ncbi:MAG: tail fiber domain-containing protein, partial [Leptospiraceae bacterium]|nr:tail fiber domain-containing protein [Leptospiraceae bacterium]